MVEENEVPPPPPILPSYFLYSLPKRIWPSDAHAVVGVSDGPLLPHHLEVSRSLVAQGSATLGLTLLYGAIFQEWHRVDQTWEQGCIFLWFSRLLLPWDLSSPCIARNPIDRAALIS